MNNYHFNNGDVTADVGMLFLGWKEGMKQLGVSKIRPCLPIKKDGKYESQYIYSSNQRVQSHRWSEFWQDVLIKEKSSGKREFCDTGENFKF